MWPGNGLVRSRTHSCRHLHNLADLAGPGGVSLGWRCSRGEVHDHAGLQDTGSHRLNHRLNHRLQL